MWWATAQAEPSVLLGAGFAPRDGDVALTSPGGLPSPRSSAAAAGPFPVLLLERKA